MKLAVFGALGRMGKLISILAPEYGYKVISAIEPKASGNVGKNYFEELTGKPGNVIVSPEINEDAEIALDFTLPVALE